MGIAVWTTKSWHARVHLTPECVLLTSRSHGPLYEVDIAEVQAPYLCRRCFPQVQRLRVHHQRCQQCGQQRALPCPHNGAILVYVPQRDGRSKRPPGTPQGVVEQTRWVWPENAYLYTLVNPVGVT